MCVSPVAPVVRANTAAEKAVAVLSRVGGPAAVGSPRRCPALASASVFRLVRIIPRRRILHEGLKKGHFAWLCSFQPVPLAAWRTKFSASRAFQSQLLPCNALFC
eukprot:5016904-Pyramimonas_sp.AAC.1